MIQATSSGVLSPAVARATSGRSATPSGPCTWRCQRKRSRSRAIGAGAIFYNVDFSLQHQLRLAGATPQQISDGGGGGDSSAGKTPVRDPIARKKRLKQLRLSADESASSKVAFLVLFAWHHTRVHPMKPKG